MTKAQEARLLGLLVRSKDWSSETRRTQLGNRRSVPPSSYRPGAVTKWPGSADAGAGPERNPDAMAGKRKESEKVRGLARFVESRLWHSRIWEGFAHGDRRGH
jgi:hypothetical protein